MEFLVSHPVDGEIISMRGLFLVLLPFFAEFGKFVFRKQLKSPMEIAQFHVV